MTATGVTGAPSPVEEFAVTGAAVFGSQLSADQVEELGEVADALAAARPGGEAFWCESGLADRYPAVGRVLLGSPVAALMAEILGAERVWLYEDTMLVKEVGEEPGTPWHQDLAHYPAAGSQIATVWIPLDEVDETNGMVRYVVGSHTWGRLFEPVRFGDRKRFPAEGFDPIPDVDLAGTIGFRTSPGDLVVHDGRVIHGTPPARIARRRRALAASYFGPDVRFRQTHFPPARDAFLAGSSFQELLPLAWPP